MKIFQRFIEYILYSLILIVYTTQDSNAYIDPGSGSMMLQVLIAAVLGALTAVKIYWHKIKNFFSRSPKPDSTEED